MENLVGKWGGTNMYNIVLSNQLEFVHPDDLVRLKDYKHIKSLHKCIATDNDFIVLEFGEFKFKVKENIFYPLDTAPEFLPFQKIKLKNSKGELEFGTIKGIYWHNNERSFYYEVEVNGKMKGRRYYAKDLENLENQVIN